MPRLLSTMVLVLFMSAPSAWADLITVDADGFPSGTDISNSFSGVTLSASGVWATDGKVYSDNGSGNTSTGTQVFGHRNNGFNVIWGINGAFFRADFDSATDFVAIDIIEDSSGDAGTVEIYDSNDNLLDMVSLSIPGGIGGIQTFSFSRAVPDIAYVVATGTTSRSVQLDNLRFNLVAIPEPTTMTIWGVLFVAGAGYGWRRRRVTV